MTRHVRSWALAALAVFALAGAATPSVAGITYNVTNYALGQNGWSLAGTITASGVGTFSDASAITAWDITASKQGSVSHRYSNSTSSATYPIGLFGSTLNATSSSLELATGAQLRFQEDNNNSYLVWYNAWTGEGTITEYDGAFSNTPLWSTGAFSPIVGGAWTLGTTGSAAVPEIDPATGGSALSLVAGVLAMIEQRRRRAMRVA